MKYTKEAIEKTLELEKRILNRVREELDVFGRPVGKVSARVQRIRDIQAGHRRAQPVLKRQTMVWHEAPQNTVKVQPIASPPAEPEETYEDWVERMKTAMDRCADHMEK